MADIGVTDEQGSQQAFKRMVDQAILDAIASNGAVTNAMGFATVLPFLFLSRHVVPTWLLVLWSGAICIAIVWRTVLLLAYRKSGSSDAESVKRTLRQVVQISFFGGLIFAVGSLSFYWLDGVLRMLYSMTLVAMCAGVVLNQIGSRRGVLMFTVPSIGVTGLMWVVCTEPAMMDSTRYLIAALVIALGYALVELAARLNRAFAREILVRQDNVVLSAQLAQSAVEARQANQAKTHFLAAASHELKQPLHTLTLLVGSLSVRKLDDRSSEIVGQMMGAAKHLSRELESLLLVSRMDAGVVEPLAERVSLPCAVAPVLASFGNQASEQGVTLRANTDAKVWAMADPVMLDQILRHLIDNALTATSDGEIFVDIRSDQSFALLEVIDTGTGIEPQDLESVMEDFYRVDRDEQTAGLGLGLPICRRLIRMQGGSVTMASEPGQGTRVTVCLPLAEKDPPQAADSGPISAISILVVNTHGPKSAMTVSLLAGLGVQISVAHDRWALLDLLDGDPPSVLLVEDGLADGSSAFEVVQLARGKVPGLPALVIVGPSEDLPTAPWAAMDIQVVRRPVMVESLASTLRLLTMARSPAPLPD